MSTVYVLCMCVLCVLCMCSVYVVCICVLYVFCMHMLCRLWVCACTQVCLVSGGSRSRFSTPGSRPGRQVTQGVGCDLCPARVSSRGPGDSSR